MPKEYFIDSEDEAMYLEMLEELDTVSAIKLYNKIKGDKADTHLSNKARLKTFEEMSYKNLRYLLLGCERCGAELRLKAYATFIARASTDVALNPLVDNSRLKEILHRNLEDNIEKIYSWSKVKYNEE